ncbi:MAG: tetratricopeptide repeat protein [Desulfosalsimonadaceae bacterium]
MTDNKKNALRGKSGKGHLLLSETDVRPKKTPPKDAGGVSETEEDSGSSASDEALFLEYATEEAKSAETFGAMAVRIDAADRVCIPDKAIADTTGIIEKICEKTSGAVRMTDKGFFLCYLPGADEKSCRGAAEKIGAQIAKRANETVRIGIAVYPTISFEKKDVFENAKKALIHADFFGPGSIVCFDAVSLNISGDAFYQAGQLDEALAEYERALAIDPENVNVHNSIGVCHGDREDWDSALVSFDRAIELDPEDAFAIYNAGYIYMQKGDCEKALGYFQRAMKTDDNIFELLFQTGRALYELGRFEEALSYLQQALSKNETPGNLVYRAMGDCNMALDHTDEAIKAYNTALKQRPDDAHSLSALALCYENENSNPEIALVFGENAVEIQPKNGLFHHRLAMMYFSRNRYEEALAHFETAVACGHAESDRYLENARELIAGSAKQKNAAGS